MLVESDQKSLTYSTLTQAASEIASGRKQDKNPSLTEQAVC